MKFSESEKPVTHLDIQNIENELSIELPKPLKDLYLIANGGSPEPYVYEDDIIDTVISLFLPILTSPNSWEPSAAQTYKDLVIYKRIVPKNYFPFAIEGGGDYFFIDCLSKEHLVYFYSYDNSPDELRLQCLNITFDEFWKKLKPE